MKAGVNSGGEDGEVVDGDGEEGDDDDGDGEDGDNEMGGTAKASKALWLQGFGT